MLIHRGTLINWIYMKKATAQGFDMYQQRLFDTKLMLAENLHTAKLKIVTWLSMT